MNRYSNGVHTCSAFMKVLVTFIASMGLLSAVGQEPISIQLAVLPPYSTNFEDYLGYSGETVLIQLSCSPVAQGVQTFYLGGALTQEGASAPISIEAPALPVPPPSSVITMFPGEVRFLTGNDLSPFFVQERMNFVNITQKDLQTFYLNKIIPEGDYRICLVAYDYVTQQPISAPSPQGCSGILPIRYYAPPFFTNPACHISEEVGNLGSAGAQNILFSWQPPAGLPLSASLNYVFQIIETPVGMDPNQVFFNTTFIPFEVNTGNQSSFYYNAAHPPLIPGRRYAIRVQAIDPAGAVQFENQGYSPVCSFVFGQPSEYGNDGTSTIVPELYINTNAPLFYFEEYLNDTEDLWSVRSMLPYSPANTTQSGTFTVYAEIESTELEYKIITKREVTIEKVYSAPLADAQPRYFDGEDLLEAFGNFETDSFLFEGNQLLLKSYELNGEKRLVLPPGNYQCRIQLREENGIDAISVLRSVPFSIAPPFNVTPNQWPTVWKNTVHTTFTNPAETVLNINGLTGISNAILFDLEYRPVIKKMDGSVFSVRPKLPFNCGPYTITAAGQETVSQTALSCSFKNWSAEQLEFNVNGSWNSVPDDFSTNGKLRLPGGNYSLQWEVRWRGSAIVLSGGVLNQWQFSVPNVELTEYPLEVVVEMAGAKHRWDSYVLSSEASPDAPSFLRARARSVDPAMINPYVLRASLQRLDEPVFTLTVSQDADMQQTWTPLPSMEWEMIKGPELQEAFGRFVNSSLTITAGSGVSNADLFPFGSLQLPPGNYRLNLWATNVSGSEIFSDPQHGVEFFLGPSVNIVCEHHEPLMVMDGKIRTIFDRSVPPALRIQRVDPDGSVRFKVIPAILGVTGEWSGKKLQLRQEYITSIQCEEFSLEEAERLFGSVDAFFAKGRADHFTLDGLPLSESATYLGADGFRYVLFPDGRYTWCYDVYTPSTKFELSAEDAACREFQMGDGNDYTADASFECAGVVPPMFDLRPVYPAVGDTLPFRMFPFIVQFCPYSDGFKRATGVFRAMDASGAVRAERTDISNNWWPNGPQAAQNTAVNQQVPEGMPEINITQERATFLPVYENYGGVNQFPSSVFERGESYTWESSIRLFYRENESVSESDMQSHSASTSGNNFGFGMTTPVLAEPANDHTLAPGDVVFKFNKGTIPDNIIPPLDIVQTYNSMYSLSGAGASYTMYDGLLQEACVLQIAKNPEFTELLFVSAPIRVNGSFRELINSSQRFDLLQQWYGPEELTFNISTPGGYYWRVGWLKQVDVPVDYSDPEGDVPWLDYTNPEGDVPWSTGTDLDFYHVSPVYKFTIDPAAVSDQATAECSYPVSNTTYATGLAPAILNNYICIGKFRMQIKEVAEANMRYSGFGIICWQNVPFKVVFSNLKINQDWQVYDGVARCEKQMPSSVSAWIQENLPQLDQQLTSSSSGVTPITNTSISIVEQIMSISAAANGQAMMPYGLNLNITDMDGGMRSFIFAMVDMEFTAERAAISALLDYDLSGFESVLELATTGVTIQPDGFAGDYIFFLPKDKEVSLGQDVKLGMKGCTFVAGTSTTSASFSNDGTYFRYRAATSTTGAAWEAALALSLKLAAGENKALSEVVDEKDGWISFHSQNIITSGGGAGWVMRFDVGEKFAFTDVPKLKMSCDDVVLDLSSATNHNTLSEEKLRLLMDSYYELSGTPELFRGLYFGKISAEHKKILSGTRMEFKDLLIDFSGGFYGKFIVSDLVSKSLEWGFTIDELGIEWKRSFKKAYMKGKVPLPIAMGDPLSYECNLQKTEGQLGLRFVVSTGEELDADALLATIRLQNSTIDVVIPFNEDPVVATALLHGQLTLNPDALGVGGVVPNLSAYTFQNLKLSTRPFANSSMAIENVLYYSAGSGNRSGTGSSSGEGTVSEHSSNREGTVHGFGAEFSDFGLLVAAAGGEGAGAKVGVKFNLALSLGPTGRSEAESAQFGVRAAGDIKIVGGVLRYDPDNGLSFEVSPEVSLGEELEISGKIGPVTIREGSSIAMYSATENSTFGDGFAMNLSVSIDFGGEEITGTLASKFGNVAGYKYFGLGINLAIEGSGIPLAPPFFLSGMGGGFAVNMAMEREPIMDASAGINEYSCSGNEDMLDDYKPRRNAHMFFVQAQGYVKSADVFQVCLKMKANIENGRLARLIIFGKGMMMPKDERGILEGTLAIVIDNTESAFLFTLTADVETRSPLPSSDVNLTLQIRNEAGDTDWYMLCGKPGAPNSVSFQQDMLVAEVETRLTFYFLMGNDLVTANAFDPAKPIPALILEAASGGDNAARKQEVERFFSSFQDNILTILNGGTNSLGEGRAGGLAFGAGFDMNMDVTFLILYFNFRIEVGFDLALLHFPGGLECGNVTAAGMNNWYAVGQMYAGMAGDLGVKVKLWFYKGKVSLINAKVAAMIQGGGPNPWWGKGALFVRGEVLGGLVSVNTEFKFSFGNECRPDPFDLDNIKIINEVTPADGSNNIDIFTEPVVSFNNRVSEGDYPASGRAANTPRMDIRNTKVFKVEYELDNDTWVNREFCFVLNKLEVEYRNSEGQWKTIGDIDYSVGQGRPVLAPDGFSASVNLDGYTLYGTTDHKVKVEVEILERMGGGFLSSSWLAPNENDDPRKTPVRVLRYERVGYEDPYIFKTGLAPDYIVTDRVLYATPVPEQRNFHPGDAEGNRWSIVFKQEIPNYLTEPQGVIQALNGRPDIDIRAEFTVRFIGEDGDRAEMTCAPFNANERNWQGALPAGLRPGKVYRVEWIRTWKGVNDESQRALLAMSSINSALASFRQSRYISTSTTDTVSASIRDNRSSASISNAFTQSLVLSYHFRVSNYRTFAEKMQAIPFTATREGDHIVYRSPNSGGMPELFDEVDMRRHKVFPGNSDVFPPLYSFSFLPNDNRAPALALSGSQVGNFPGGMESLDKMYRDGFYRIHLNTRGFASGDSDQGLQFLDHWAYNASGVDTRLLPIRATPDSPESVFKGSSNTLAFFPFGAIRTTFFVVQGRLSTTQRFAGALAVYAGGTTGASSSTNAVGPTITFGSTGIAKSGTGSIFGSAANIIIRVEIQEAVKKDYEFYRELLRSAAVEMNRLSKTQAGASNTATMNAVLPELLWVTLSQTMRAPFNAAPAVAFSPVDHHMNLIIRLWKLAGNKLSQFDNPALNIELNNLHREFFEFQPNRPGSMPQWITTLSNLGRAQLVIPSSYGRMYHALRVYEQVFNRNTPNPNFIDTYMNAMGINVNDVFRNLNSLTFRVRYSAFNARGDAFFNDQFESLVPSSALVNKGTFQLIKP